VSGARPPSRGGGALPALADRLKFVAEGPLTLAAMPRYWFWLQIVTVVFVFTGMVIAITKLA
jgi:hypothetical protein